ncbi:MAG: hypothetical protein R2911_29880 [Caldilineaceae bacterium]
MTLIGALGSLMGVLTALACFLWLPKPADAFTGLLAALLTALSPVFGLVQPGIAHVSASHHISGLGGSYFLLRRQAEQFRHRLLWC